MAGEVSFKAYLSVRGEDGAKPEVRRFSLDQNVATSFIYLKEKLRSLFPSLSLSLAFDIYWKDNDGDHVAISTDDELTIALTDNRVDDVIKIYIQSSKPTPTPVNTMNSPVHDGVFCDGCENLITGFRYKCLGCREFDLCSGCESTGVHGEHFALRIPTPLNKRHNFGHKLIHKLSKATRKAESRCPWTHRYENLASEFNTNCSTEESPSERPQCSRGRCSDGPRVRGAGRGPTAPPPPIALDIGQIPNVIFSTLADFGIDLSQLFPAPQPQEGTQTPSGQQETPSAPSQPTQQATSPSAQSTQTPTQTPTSNNANDKPEEKTQSAVNEESSAPKMPKISSNEPNTPAVPQAQAKSSLLDDWAVYNPNGQETNPEVMEIEINSSNSSVVGEKEKEANAGPSGVQAETSNQLYPSLAGLPKNKKVAEALDQMLAMGFKNDDGWLTNLLNLQDGSIAKVLDLIQSAAQGKQ